MSDIDVTGCQGRLFKITAKEQTHFSRIRPLLNLRYHVIKFLEEAKWWLTSTSADRARRRHLDACHAPQRAEFKAFRKSYLAAWERPYVKNHTKK